MLLDGKYVDNTWDLSVTVNFNNFRTKSIKLRVHGSQHIALIQQKLVKSLKAEEFEDDEQNDWSDHSLWWPQLNMWLLKHCNTLDQYGVQSTSNICFIKRNNNIIIVLPSLKKIKVTVDFSQRLFLVVIGICKQFCIRYPEELSLMQPLQKDNLCLDQVNPNAPLSGYESIRRNKKKPVNKYQRGDMTLGRGKSFDTLRHTGSYTTLTRGSSLSSGFSASQTLNENFSSSFNTNSRCGDITINAHPSLDSIKTHCLDDVENLTQFKERSSKVVIDRFLVTRTNDLIQKSYLNSTWLQSHLSLMEQGITPDSLDQNTGLINYSVLWLRFKYYSFFDLMLQYDSVRIHQAFEQARWSLLSNQVDCTEDEIVGLAALQLQINIDNSKENATDEIDGNVLASANDTELDNLLGDMEAACIGDDSSEPQSPGDKRNCLEGYIKMSSKDNKKIKKSEKRWIVMQDMILMIFKKSDKTANSHALCTLQLQGCDVMPDVDLIAKKYALILSVINDSKKEIYVFKFDLAVEYAQWMAALTLCSRGKSMKNLELFQREVTHIMEMFTTRAPSSQNHFSASHCTPIALEERLRDLSQYMPDNLIRRSKSVKHLQKRIFKSYTQVSMLTGQEARLRYLQTWQHITGSDISYVLVRFENAKKNELLGVNSLRVIRVDPNTGASIKSWPFTSMKSWHANWDTKKIVINTSDGAVTFMPIGAECKTVLELIGGNIFMNQRRLDKSQDLDEKLFHQLTGVNVEM